MNTMVQPQHAKAGRALARARRVTANYALTLAFSPDTPERLLKTGVYARIRHPFYTAYTITWLAGIVAAPSVWTLVMSVVMFSAYWFAATMEEKKFARSELSDEYLKYCSEAGMFWPFARWR